MKNCSLNSDVINTKVSRRAIDAAILLVEFNHSVDRRIIYEDYYCAVFVEISKIRDSVCDLLLFDNETNTVFVEWKKIDLSFLPPKLITDIKKLPYRYGHVLLRKRIFYNGVQENKLIVPIGQKFFAYASNELKIDKDGLLLLQAFWAHEDECWENIQLPRYKTLLRFVKFFTNTFFKQSFFYKKTA